MRGKRGVGVADGALVIIGNRGTDAVGGTAVGGITAVGLILTGVGYGSVGTRVAAAFDGALVIIGSLGANGVTVGRTCVLVGAEALNTPEGKP